MKKYDQLEVGDIIGDANYGRSGVRVEDAEVVSEIYIDTPRAKEILGMLMDSDPQNISNKDIHVIDGGWHHVIAGFSYDKSTLGLFKIQPKHLVTKETTDGV